MEAEGLVLVVSNEGVSNMGVVIGAVEGSGVVGNVVGLEVVVGAVVVVATGVFVVVVVVVVVVQMVVGAAGVVAIGAVVVVGGSVGDEVV